MKKHMQPQMTISEEILNDLYCPAMLINNKVQTLTEKNGYLVSEIDKYPIIDGIPDLRLQNDRQGTSYDDILPEWDKPSSGADHQYINDAFLERRAELMGIKKEDIYNKKVLVAGIGGGTEIDLIISFKPAIVYALDFSSFAITLSKKTKYNNISFFLGDICNLPFKPELFDYIISGGIIQATRSPELAHRCLWRTLKSSGKLNYGHIYIEQTQTECHNTRVSIDRLRNKFHYMNPKKAKIILKRYVNFYTFLNNYGILRLINRKRFRMPYLLELSGKRGVDAIFHYISATDYYLSRYRHIITAEDIVDWFAQVGCKVERTPKGWIGQKT